MENMKHEGAIMVIEHLWDRVIHESHLFFAAEEEIMELPEGEIKNNYLEVIIKYSLQQGWEEEAQKRAEALKRKLRVDEWRVLFSFYMKNKSWNDVIRIAKRSKKRITIKEKEAFLVYDLERCYLNSAQEMAEALKRKLRVDELKFLLENIEKNGSRKQMEEAIELLPEEETRTKRKFLKILIKDYLDHQLYKKAKRIAKILDDLYKEEIKEG